MAKGTSTYTFEMPDGTKRYVRGPSGDRPGAFAELRRQREAIAQQEYSHLPLGAQIGTALDDQARIAANAMAFGSQHIADRLASLAPGGDYEKEKYLTEEARHRAGWAGTAMEGLGIASTAAALPSAGPAAAARFGGPGWVQGITKGVISAPETATLMAGQAAAEGEDPAEAAWQGAMFGPAAHTLVGAGKGILSAANYADDRFLKGAVKSGAAKVARGAAKAGEFAVRGLKRPVQAAADAAGVGTYGPTEPGAYRFGRDYLGPTFFNEPEQTKSVGERVGERIGKTLYGTSKDLARNRFGAINDPVTGETPEQVIARQQAEEAKKLAAEQAASDAKLMAAGKEIPMASGGVSVKGPLADAAGVVAAPPVVNAAQPGPPAGPLAAPKVNPKLAAAQAKLAAAQDNLARAKTDLSMTKGATKKIAINNQIKAFESAVERHTKAVDKLSAVTPKVAEDTALEAAGAATPPVAPVVPAGPLAAETAAPAVSLGTLRAQREVLDRQLQDPTMPTAQKARVGAALKDLDQHIANYKEPVPEGPLAAPKVEGAAGTPEEQAIAQKAYDDADARLAKAQSRFRADQNPRTAEALRQADAAAKTAHIANMKAKGITPGKATTAPILPEGEEAVVPRKAAAGKVLPEPNVKSTGKPGTKKVLSTNAPNWEAAKDPAKVAKAKKQAKSEPTPEDLRAEAVERLNRAVSSARLRSGALGGGFDAALIKKTVKLAEDPAFMRNFSAEEQAAILKMSQGDPAMKTARWLAKFPSLQSTATTVGGGTMLGMLANPWLGAAVAAGPPLGGLLGRAVRNSGARQNARAALDFVNQRAPAAPIIDPKRARDLTTTLRLLLGGGG